VAVVRARGAVVVRTHDAARTADARRRTARGVRPAAVRLDVGAARAWTRRGGAPRTHARGVARMADADRAAHSRQPSCARALGMARAAAVSGRTAQRGRACPGASVLLSDGRPVL